MFCPQCRAEFREGFDSCADCDIELVAEPPPPEDHSAPTYITLFETSQVDVAPVIKSLLDSAEIPYSMQGGEAMMNLFPSDMLGKVMSGSAREVRFQVPEDRLEEAKTLLEAQPVDTPELRPEEESQLSPLVKRPR